MCTFLGFRLKHFLKIGNQYDSFNLMYCYVLLNKNPSPTHMKPQLKNIFYRTIVHIDSYFCNLSMVIIAYIIDSFAVVIRLQFYANFSFNSRFQLCINDFYTNIQTHRFMKLSRNCTVRRLYESKCQLRGVLYFI